MTYVCRMPVCCQGYKTDVMPRLVSSWTWQVEVSWRCLRTWWTSPRLGRRCSIGVQENDTTCKRWKTCMTNIAKDIWWDWKNWLLSTMWTDAHTHTHTHEKKKLKRNELCTVWVQKWLDIFHSGDTIAYYSFISVPCRLSSAFQDELTKLRSKEMDAKHSYEMLTQSLQDDDLWIRVWAQVKSTPRFA